MLAVVQFANVLPDIGPPDTGVALDTHVVTESQNDLIGWRNGVKRAGEGEGVGRPGGGLKENVCVCACACAT